MTREDIVRMARSAIRLSVNDASLTEFDAEKTILSEYEFLYWFAREVSANEREACAKVCADKARTVTNKSNAKTAINHCTAAIRARGSNGF